MDIHDPRVRCNLSDDKVAKVFSQSGPVTPDRRLFAYTGLYLGDFWAAADQKKFCKQASWRCNAFFSGINKDTVEKVLSLSTFEVRGQRQKTNDKERLTRDEEKGNTLY